MFKKALWMMIPFMLIFLLGLILLMRPQYQVPIVEVMDTFTRQEKTGQRSAHRHTVDYATVKVELDGEEHKVTVHDNSWQPLKDGDTVVVARGFFGRIVEYRSKSAYTLNGNSTGHKPPTTAASIPRRSNGGITRKPTGPRIMAPENPVIKSLSEQKKNPENPCYCGVFGILAIIPTQPPDLITS